MIYGPGDERVQLSQDIALEATRTMANCLLKTSFVHFSWTWEIYTFNRECIKYVESFIIESLVAPQTQNATFIILYMCI